MKWTAAALAVAGTALASEGAAVTGAVSPDSKAPAGCKASHDGPFEVTIYALGNSKRDVLQKRSCNTEGNLLLSLQGGILKDSKDRTGYVASNYQFQFDGPPQANAIYTAGFSLCSNNSLALGGSTMFWRCLSGSFYNLYDRKWAEQCSPIEIVAMPCSGNSGSGAQNGGAKPVGTQMVATTVISAIGDGQPQVHTKMVPVPMCQIGDGQVQIRTTPCAAVTQIGDGQPQAPTGGPVPISQISDGQIQGPPSMPPPAPPVTQIGDGQPQAPTGAPVTQIGDGQPQAPSGPAVTQIGDGQPQAPTGAPVTQIGDGQPQAPKSNATVPVNAGDKLFPGYVAAAAAVFGAALAL